MRLFFWRRRPLADFADAIRPELEAIDTPEPSPQLLERILASRAASARVILPEPVARRAGVSKRAIATIVVAAAILLVTLPMIRVTRTGDEVVASSGFFVREAFAQPPGAERPGLSPVTFARAVAIRPLELELTRRIWDAAGKLVNESVDSLAVVTAEVAGMPAWRVTSRTRDLVGAQHRVQTETLYVARDDLRPLERAIHVSPYSRFERINVRQSFRGDSVTGRMTTDGPSIGAGRPIARRLRPELAPFLTDAFAPIALMATPVAPTWAGSATLLGWAVIPRDVFFPIELRVEGEERITVPAGTFDCWRLSIRYRGQAISYWTRKSDGLGVRVLDQRDASAKGTHETVLRRVTE